MSRFYKEIERSSNKTIENSRFEICDLQLRLNKLNDVVLERKEALKYAKVFEESKIINIFEKVIDSGVLKPEVPCIQWADSNSVVSLLFGAHDAIYKDRRGEVECLKDTYLYQCVFFISSNGQIMFNNDVEHNFQGEMFDGEHSAWKRKEKLENYFRIDLRQAEWQPIENFSGGVSECVSRVISVYNKIEKKKINMREINQILTTSNEIRKLRLGKQV